MFRLFNTVLLAAVILGGIWVLLNRDRIESPSDVVAMVRDQLPAAPVSFQRTENLRPTVAGGQPAFPSQPVIRVASLKLNRFGASVEHGERLELLAEICGRYDAIALQGVAAGDDLWLDRLAIATSQITSNGDYAYISDADQSTNHPTQNAILFNRNTLEIDHLHWYTVNDPDQLLNRNPLVGWFRTRVPDLTRAFTFTLVNVEMTGHGPDLELAWLSELFRAIRNDGRGEDDVILAGDFGSGDRGLEPIQRKSGLIWAVSNTPTDIHNTAQYDNLIFSPTATTEFTGQGGVFDFLRQYNLRSDDAESIASHLPVWAEFSVIEGGVPVYEN